MAELDGDFDLYHNVLKDCQLGEKNIDDYYGYLRDYKGKKVCRDMIQTVNFQESMANGSLAKDVLCEIPTHVEEYMERMVSKRLLREEFQKVIEEKLF